LGSGQGKHAYKRLIKGNVKEDVIKENLGENALWIFLGKNEEIINIVINFELCYLKSGIKF
jgi:hypothetical protein